MIPRRTFLRSSSALIALPFLESLGFRRFVAKLKSISEAGGTLLDNCLITFGSAMGDGRKHDHGQLPCVVAGSAGGQIDTGRHLSLEKETPMANLFVSTLQHAGAPLKQFGDSTGEIEL